MNLPRLLILSFTDARRDPRVHRQAIHLREHFLVTLAGLGNPEIDGVAFLPLERRKKSFMAQAWIACNLLLGNHGPASRRFRFADAEQAFSRRWDIVLVNDAEPLPLGFALARNAPIVFDAHEFYPLEFESSLNWRIFLQHYLTRLCQEYIPRCAAMTTVSPGIAKRYERDFGVLPEVVFSAPDFVDQPPSLVDPARIRMVHHGAANRDRELERMIDVIRRLDGRFSLDMYLIGDEGYINELKALAADCPAVRWCKPLPMREIASRLNGYDIGLCFLTPNTFNIAHSVPNKLLEFLQARLAVAIGPSPDMAAIVNEHDLGVVTDDFSPQSLAEALNALRTEDITRYKRNADKAARIYHAENGIRVLLDIFFQKLGISAPRCHCGQRCTGQ